MTGKKVAISIKLDSQFRDQLTNKAKNQDLSLSAYIRKCIDAYDQSNTESDQSNTEYDEGNTESDRINSDYIQTLKQQLDIKDQQIDDLLKQHDQTQQLFAVQQKQLTTPFLSRLRQLFSS